jgi:hypothetical protein
MEAQYSKSQWKHWSTLTLLVLISAIFMFAGCGKKSHSNVNPYGYNPYGYGNGTCPSCTGSNQFMLAALGVSYTANGQPRMELGLEFYGAGAVGGTQNPYDQYSGQVQAQGRLYVNVGDYYCSLAPGQYDVTTVQPGTMQYQSIYDLKLIATPVAGGAGVQMQIALPSNFVSARTSSQIGQDGRTYPYRLQNRVYVNTSACSFFLE